MKLLLDQGLPRSTAAILRGKHLEAVHVGELEMWAPLTRRSWLTPLRRSSYGRFERGLRAVEAAELVLAAIEHIDTEHEAGSFVAVTLNAVRVRKLPGRPGVD